MSKKVSNKTKKWIEAPKPTKLMPVASAVLGVFLAKGEDVEWVWTHTDKGSYVSGYNIILSNSLQSNKLVLDVVTGSKKLKSRYT